MSTHFENIPLIFLTVACNFFLLACYVIVTWWVIQTSVIFVSLAVDLRAMSADLC